MLDRLLRGRGWVMLIGALLAGIVFLNVSVLELNRGIAATTASSAKLEAQNSVMRARLADVASPEAIQRAAQALGFVLPQPGDVGYLRIRPGDAAVAAKRLDDSQASATTQAVTPSVPQTATPTAGPAAAPPVTPATATSAVASAPATGTAAGTASASPTPAAAAAASGGR